MLGCLDVRVWEVCLVIFRSKSEGLEVGAPNKAGVNPMAELVAGKIRYRKYVSKTELYEPMTVLFSYQYGW